MNLKNLIFFFLTPSLLFWTGCDDPPGCLKDTDCRGLRICINGTCQEPDEPDLPDGFIRPDGSTREIEEDTDSPEVCQGSSKVVTPNQIISPVAITANYQLFRSCCEDLSITFHTQDDLGFNITTSLGWMAGDPGEVWDVQNLDGLSTVNICHLHPNTCELVDLSGQVEFENMSDGQHIITLCLEITDPRGGDLDGFSLFADSVFVPGFSWNDRLEFRLLSDPDLSAEQAALIPLHDLALADYPLFNLSDIATYTPETYTFQINQFSLYRLDELPPVGVFGLPFVLLVDGERLFLGSFHTLLSSSCGVSPQIIYENIGEGELTMGWSCSLPPGPDPRDDLRLLEILRDASKLIE